MRNGFFTLLFTIICTSIGFSQKTDLMLLGSDHLTQLYKKDKPNTDVLLADNQSSINSFTKSVLAYKPDVIMVEVLPEKQQEIDSLYTLYLNDKIKLESIEDGRSEVYQLAFRMAKELKLAKIYCVNAPGGTSQSILDNGDNIALYKEEGVALREIVIEKVNALAAKNISFKDYLTFINQPDTYNKIYHLRYITPSRITNGTFKNPDAMVDTAFINKKYIGAELTSIFKNRDYKIYSNIVTTQLKTKSKRIVLIYGAAHIGSFISIFRDDQEYNLVSTKKYL